MKSVGKIVKERIEKLKSLMEYLDEDGNPKYPKAEEFYIYDWIDGNTKYKKLTNKLLKNKNL